MFNTPSHTRILPHPRRFITWTYGRDFSLISYLDDSKCGPRISGKTIMLLMVWYSKCWTTPGVIPDWRPRNEVEAGCLENS